MHAVHFGMQTPQEGHIRRARRQMVPSKAIPVVHGTEVGLEAGAPDLDGAVDGEDPCHLEVDAQLENMAGRDGQRDVQAATYR